MRASIAEPPTGIVSVAAPADESCEPQTVAVVATDAGADAGSDGGVKKPCRCPKIQVLCTESLSACSQDKCLMALPDAWCAKLGLRTGETYPSERLRNTQLPEEPSVVGVLAACGSRHEGTHACQTVGDTSPHCMEVEAHKVSAQCLREAWTKYGCTLPAPEGSFCARLLPRLVKDSVNLAYNFCRCKDNYEHGVPPTAEKCLEACREYVQKTHPGLVDECDGTADTYR